MPTRRNFNLPQISAAKRRDMLARRVENFMFSEAANKQQARALSADLRVEIGMADGAEQARLTSLLAAVTERLATFSPI